MKISLSIILWWLTTALSASCKKNNIPPVDPDPPVPKDTTTVRPVTDPAVANTVGFFLNDWEAKTFNVPDYAEAAIPNIAASNIVTVDASSIITKIPRTITGHNANTWMTPMTDQPQFMNHITNLRPHVIRWPAGSGSNLYFWNRPAGDIPEDAPVKLMNSDGVLKDAGYWFGKTDNNWSASIDQYYQMREQSGNNEGVITINYGYARYGTSADPVAAAAHLAADWVRYDNGRTTYWEIGNENFGEWEAGYRIDVSQNKDGQPEYLTGKLYAQHFKVFADSMRKAAAETGKTIYIGAVTYDVETQAWQTNTVKTWNQTMMPELNGANDYFIVHSYFTPYQTNSTAGDILNAALTVPEKMMDFVTGQIQNYGGNIKPVALTEWNMFAEGSRQQVSNVSGVFATIVLGEAIKNKYGLAARWDLLNSWDNGNDHGLFSDGNEPNIPKWTPRPSFYYMYFFQKLLGDRMVPVNIQGSSNIKAYASTFSSGEINTTLVNTGTTALTVELKWKNFKAGNRFYWYSLEGGEDNGAFSRKVSINGNSTAREAGGPENYASIKARSASAKDGIKVTIPAGGVVIVAVDKK
ncbi:MAG: alpha-L-arabinofuranosidase [Chitinophagaceae bacterium]|nr:alpha-L-arabinofuranosidase [Chitinophagaceae bacterium]